MQGSSGNTKFTSNELTSRSHYTCLCFVYVLIVGLSESLYVSITLPVNHAFFPPWFTYQEIEYTFIYKHLISCIMHLNSHISLKKTNKQRRDIRITFENHWKELKVRLQAVQAQRLSRKRCLPPVAYALSMARTQLCWTRKPDTRVGKMNLDPCYNFSQYYCPEAVLIVQCCEQTFVG